MSTSPRLVGPIGYGHSENVPNLFQALGISLIITTYQAQSVLCLAANGERMVMTQRYFERPTGAAYSGRELVVGTRRMIWRFTPTGALRRSDGGVLEHDLVLAPRQSHVTGDMLVHDLDFAGDTLVAVCTFQPGYSFVPLWRPPFISGLTPDDRCHLNGVATNADGPLYVTARAEADTAEGWRQQETSSGFVMHVPSGEMVARGLVIPHSPRLHNERLYVLDSGRGELVCIDAASGRRETVVRLPGFLRGLAFYDRFAFVGLCKARENREFGGTPLDEMRDALQCAVSVVDLATGAEIARVTFTQGVEELFSVAVLPQARKPLLVGLEEDTIDGIFVVPPQVTAP
ncbi:MAG: TIGR03032 family protein [Proteobacteria bacterium]|nr:TIGR03032 family protein [Pseudomonadota bacterium]